MARFIRLALTSCVASISFVAFAQTPVTAVHTDFGGYWYSENGSINAVHPNDHNLMLGFAAGGTTYSTGVDDSELDNQGVTYTAGDWNAITVPHLPTSVVPYYSIMLGAAIDGNASGVGTITAPADSTEVAAFLIDGTRGLDFGTGIANVVTGDFDFTVSSPVEDAINDGTPDLLFTQMAEPLGADSICFLDSDDNLVGTKTGIGWTGVGAMGRWDTDYFAMDGSDRAMNQSKPIRAVTMDFHDLGITAANAGDVVKIRIFWSGDSDPAFLAYNGDSFAGCDEFTFSGVSVVAPASGAATADGVIDASISGGTTPYGLAFLLQGDTVPSSGWNALPSGKYWVKAVDANDCMSSNSFQLFLPHSKCQ